MHGGLHRGRKRYLTGSRKDIAPNMGAILGISHRTVQTHLKRIYEKLGVESRTQAGVLLHEHGLAGRRSMSSQKSKSR